MEKKLILAGLMGMNQDVISQKIGLALAYEIKNFRLNATLDSNAFELTTEKGTKQIRLSYAEQHVEGNIIGYCVLNDYLVLFTHEHIRSIERKIDRIYRLTLNDNEVTGFVQLYEGNLDFQKDVNPTTDGLIDAIPYYETELIQKVYWIDGINQPRVINIANIIDTNNDGIIDSPEVHIDPSDKATYEYDPYGFVLEITGDYSSILVTKNYVGGMFHAGVIQYAYSFFNENAQETPVIDVTPLNYIAHEDRGEKPDTRVGCTFTLQLNVSVSLHDKFDYIRFYSIYRSSLDTTPLVKVINEIKTDNLTAIHLNSGNPIFPVSHYVLEFTDDNTLGYVYDAQQLLIRNNKIIPLTFNYKDGKLFFGNFKNEINLTDIEDNTFNNVDVSWQGSKVVEISPNEQSTLSGYENETVSSEFNVYNYKSQLQHNSQEIKTFKGNEYYHLGVQLLDKYGNWSLPYYVTTSKNTVFPKGSFYHYDYGGATHNSFIYPIYNVALAETDDNINTIINDLGIDTSNYIRIRPVVSFPTASERAILCQGIVNPTVFNLGLRVNGTCHALASWFFRPYPNSRFLLQHGIYRYLRGLSLVLWDNYAPLFDTRYLNGEVQCMYSQLNDELSPTINVETTDFDLDGWNDRPQGSLFEDDLDYPLTEYYAKKLKLLHAPQPLFYQGHGIYPYYYNISTDSDPIASPLYQSEDNYYRCTYYAKVAVEQISDETHSGYKYTVQIASRDYDIISGNYFNDDEYEDKVYYVSTNEQAWTLTDENFSLEDVRQRVYAHVIDVLHKNLYNSYYYVDTLICTLNSPDIEFDTNIQNTDTKEYSLSLVGSSRFVNNVGKYNIIALNPNFLNDVKIEDTDDWYIRSTKLATGFSTEKYETKALNNTQWLSHGGTIVSALDCWYDDACNLFTWDEHTYTWNERSLQNAYVVYPWQRKYLNNFNNNLELVDNPDSRLGITTEAGEPSLIIKKVLGNLRFCYTDYCTEQILEPVDYLKLFNSEEAQLLKTKEDKLYCGNIDQLITCSSEYNGRGVVTQTDSDTISWGIVRPLVGYPLMLGRNGTIGDSTKFQGLAYNNFQYFLPIANGFVNDFWTDFGQISPNNRSTDPIWIRYKSSPHFVFKFSNGNVLPILGNGSSSLVSYDGDTVWGHETINNPLYFNVEPVTTASTDLSYLWIADIYNPNKDDTPLSDFELLNRVWLPCGESKPLDSTDKLVWSEGDTFFQRYDCLKTYPFSNDDYQSVVEIGSFMLETRVNLDGRYDTNRGLMDNTAITKKNFNLINPVYSQMNNFFQYKMLDERFNNKDTEYKNRITWTLDKQNGDDVDLWTRVTELGIIDMDGDKGDVTKIERYDNNLYVFQEKGVARLNYNDNLQIPTEGNVPIEVINSGFVNGKRYISENVGLQEKWCSISTPSGIFFKDGYSKALYQMKYDERRNSIVAPLSQSSMQKWTETHIKSIHRVNYDNGVNEVLFMTDDNDYPSLAYSNLYQAFSSFYDYVGFIGNYKDLSFSIKQDNSTFWLLRKSDSFNRYYNNIKPYWIKWTSVIDGYDCIFDNIDFKGNIYANTANSMNDNDIEIQSKGDDIYQGGIPKIPVPFDKISVSNDRQAYEQESTPSSVWKDFKPIKKFGVWRARIPRFNSTGKQYLNSRIRNHWTRIGLKNSNPDTNKTIIRDIKVDAFF